MTSGAGPATGPAAGGQDQPAPAARGTTARPHVKSAMAYLLLSCRCLIAAVFVTSVVSKTRSRDAFRAFVSSIDDLRPAPAPGSGAIAPVVVAGEGSVAVLLAVPGAVTAGFALSASLLLAFSAAIAAAVRRGVRTPCRCFGASVTPIGVPHLVRNLLLLAASATGGLTALRSPAGVLHPAGVAVSVMTVAVVAVPLLFFFDDFVALFGDPAAQRIPPTS